MRILYVSPRVPWRVRVRSLNIVLALAKRHEVCIVCQAGSAEEEAHLEEVRPFCREISCIRYGFPRALFQTALGLPTLLPLRIAYFYSPGMRRAVREMVKKFPPDVILADRWRGLANVPADIGIPIVCDPTDSMILYNLRLARAGSWLERIIGLEEAIKFIRYEPRMSRRTALNVFCSEVDLECVRRRSPQSRFAVVPNGVDCRAFPLKDAACEVENRIMFTGTFRYAPNRHAVKFLLERVLPLVKQKIPQSRLVVVGDRARLHLAKRGKGSEDVEIFDFVPAMHPYLATASVALAPITVGSGVPNKLLEAFATGTAVVATSMACGDLPVQHRKHLLVADTARTFADAIVLLLQDTDLRRSLAYNARKLAEERYDLDVVMRSLEKFLLGIARPVSQPSLTRSTEPVAEI